MVILWVHTHHFGYIKSPDDYNKLIPDEKTKYIVQEIFELLANGVLPSNIAKKFNESGVIYPSDAVGNRHTRIDEENRGWSTAVIKKIAKNEIYLGHLVMGKSESESYKTHKVVPVPKEDWIIVYNNHEPLVTQEIFDKANEYIKSRTHTRSNSYNWLLQGLVFCEDCGSTMSLTTYTNKKGKKIHYLRCNKSSIQGNLKLCTPHSHELNIITNMVINEIKERCKEYIKKIDYKKIVDEANKELGIWYQTKDNEIKTLKRECELINKKIASLYDDWKNEFLTESDYKRLFDNYNYNRQCKEKRIIELENQTIEQKDVADTTKIVNDFVEQKNITREYIVKMINCIKLKERKTISKKKNGHKVPTSPSDITIQYKINVLNNNDLLKEVV